MTSNKGRQCYLIIYLVTIALKTMKPDALESKIRRHLTFTKTRGRCGLEWIIVHNRIAFYERRRGLLAF